MKSVPLLAFVLFAAGSLAAADSSYNFEVTSEQGKLLGSGTLDIPFVLGADGHGESRWVFEPFTNMSTNQYWLRAHALLSVGKGKADVTCKASQFTLDFNPDVNDNNVVFIWNIKEGEVGSLDFAGYAGSFHCADMKIEKPAIPSSH